ncbi:probable trehalose-phosphate phosphatase C isoform X1 [Chenopodium quinoa]|uniref:probable trehalose-phosphate phosphatase C isoform X1 n=1 Tax=Chenopodium quinoa TaxID=63459 RepID=UPI000B78DA70|nr:probable trehalose-phosphate phosphatase C isoform X1 [Chenopodium quinoa]XP_021748388.1 probable trehalose-phosphate phosphatase C isoform X1 [Chenopodium quinoa]XP_021748389.1 probable trehalose-phosphate phosphatase C isoform X1 [Chenopodium quinoa]XP_021748390.1 probable trehalose-phosphate phosphatase C isoform X1 [Chenopodium quinoa]
MGLPRVIAKLNNLKSVSSSTFDEDRSTNWHSYDSWLEKHPSALDKFQKMMHGAENKKIVVFLDYDGTLSPIVNDPDVAFMTDKMRAVVHEVGCCFPTSIISGRSREKVYDFVQLDNIYYAGSHGMDIMAPLQPLRIRDWKYHAKAVDLKGNKLVIYQPANKYLSEINQIQMSLKEKTAAIDGVNIEDNKFCMSVHFRNVSDEDLGSLEEEVKSVLEEHPHFRLTRGKKVLEIRPPIDWDKGHALEYLLDSLGLGSSNDVLPIYIGDDTSDEDAFELIHRKRQGYSIIVTSIPRETWASYSLYDTTEVMLFLEYLAKWKSISSAS